MLTWKARRSDRLSVGFQISRPTRRNRKPRKHLWIRAGGFLGDERLPRTVLRHHPRRLAKSFMQPLHRQDAPISLTSLTEKGDEVCLFSQAVLFLGAPMLGVNGRAWLRPLTVPVEDVTYDPWSSGTSSLTAINRRACHATGRKALIIMN
jgi:hypothetical protein